MYFIILLFFSTIFNAEECPFSGMSMDNEQIDSVRVDTKPPVIPTCLHRVETEQDKNTSSFNEAMVGVDKTFSVKKPDPEFARKLTFNTFYRKNDYNKGILQDIDPAIKTVIQKELGLTDYEINNIVFLHDTKDESSSNAFAYSGPNVIVFNKEMYDYAVKATRAFSKTVTLYSSRYTTNVTFPPKLALQIFLAVCSHEIEHLRKKHRGRNFTQEQEADAAVLAKHRRAYSVYFATKDVILCYHEPITDKTKKWLKDCKEETVEDELRTRDNLFKNHSHEFYKDVHSLYNTHPTYSHRAEKFKQSSSQNTSQNDSDECALVTITEKNCIPKVVLRLILICKSSLASTILDTTD